MIIVKKKNITSEFYLEAHKQNICFSKKIK